VVEKNFGQHFEIPIQERPFTPFTEAWMSLAEKQVKSARRFRRVYLERMITIRIKNREELMNEPRFNFFDPKVIIGLVIIIFGALALADNFGFDLNIDLWDYWPLILIVIGLGQILQPKEYRQTFGGLVILVIGVLFLANNLKAEFHFGFKHLWPIILLLIGAKILMHGFLGSKKDAINRDFINLTALLGGGEFNFTSKQLKGGKITAIMGGCTVDLREADIEEDTIVIDTFAMMGGIDIKVPHSWQVTMQGIPILGGMENKTKGISGELEDSAALHPEKRLIVKGMAVMGGVEVKN